MTLREQYFQIVANEAHIGKLMDMVRDLTKTCEMLHTRIGVLEEYNELFGEDDSIRYPERTDSGGNACPY